LFIDSISYVSFWQDVAVSRGDLASESNYDVHQEIMVDSVISQPRHVETGRELHRWVPDEDVPQCPELDNIFDGSWNRWLYFSLIITNQKLLYNHYYLLDLWTTLIAGAF
jgi:hypothetical protein